MTTLNYWAIGAASIAAFVEGAIWNSPLMFGNERVRLAGLPKVDTHKPPVLQMIVELLRQTISVSIFAYLLVLTGTDSIQSAILIALLLWLGFQANAIVGGLIWEKMPPRLFAIHAGDALLKTITIAAVLAAWPHFSR